MSSSLWTPFFPRSYQVPVCGAYRTEPHPRRKLHLPVTRSGWCVWHRGSGKGATVTGGVLIPAIAHRPGNYLHVFPTLVQGKGALWQEAWWRAMWPPDWDPRFIETELTVALTIAGKTARLKIVGADEKKDIDKYRGWNPLGVVYDEAAEMDESVRELSARLAMNGGWEIGLFTPKGAHHWTRKAYLGALEHPEFFAQLLTVEDTRRDAVDWDGVPLDGEDGGAVVTQADIEVERQKGHSEAWIQQEFYCAFNVATEGSIFGDRLEIARREGRVTRVPYESSKPVAVMVDIGRQDATAFIYVQADGREIRVFDFDCFAGKTWDESLAMLAGKGYFLAKAYLPHDAGHKTAHSSKSMAEKMRERFPQCRVKVVKKADTVEQTFDAVRSMFSRLVFDEVACGRDPSPSLPGLLRSLTNYSRGWSAATQDYSGKPVHDEHSHAADALRTGLVEWKDDLVFGFEGEGLQERTVCDYVPFAPRGRAPRRRQMEMAA